MQIGWDQIEIEILDNLEISILNGCAGSVSEQILKSGFHLRI